MITSKTYVGVLDDIPDDSDLIARIRNKDKDAFTELVNRHKVRAFRTAFNFVGDKELAKDIVQDAWINVYNALYSFDVKEPFYPWFRTILINLCKNVLRRRDLRMEAVAVYKRSNIRHVSTIDSLLLAKEDRGILKLAIEKLPKQYRDVVMLACFKYKSYAEISRMLHISQGTVSSRINYSKGKLKKIIKKIEHCSLQCV